MPYAHIFFCLTKFTKTMILKTIVTIDPRTNILNGGPEVEGYDDGCSSLGELIIKRLTEQGDQVLLVIICL